MRIFDTLTEAESEIRRDLKKGTPVSSTRVQQHTGVHLTGRERLFYHYTISDPVDRSSREIVEFGKSRGFLPFEADPENMMRWMDQELSNRLCPNDYIMDRNPLPERLHPDLSKTLEGEYLSYTYPERMVGMLPSILASLESNLDSRRAFWPIFHPMDALRAPEPTRIPCSIGYQFIVRKVGDVPLLMMLYMERSCDFDRFWLSDVWFAMKIQRVVAAHLKVQIGVFSHFIVSLHSFDVEGQEVY